MLLSFTVENFKSFEKPSTLTMFRGNVMKKKDHLVKVGNSDILKGAVIYGSNAGGKTSFIQAMAVSQEIILLGLSSDTLSDVETYYCRISESNRDIPSCFEYLFSTEGRCYRYSLKVILAERKIIYERLSEVNLDTGSETLIFCRNNYDDETLDFESGGYFTQEEVDRLKGATIDLEDTDRTSLIAILTYKKKYSSETRLTVFNTVASWFVRKFNVNRIPRIDMEASIRNNNLLSHFVPDFNEVTYEQEKNVPPEVLDHVKEIFSKVSFRSFARDGKCFENDQDGIRTYSMKVRHSSSPELFDISEESKGTRELSDYTFLLSDSYDDYTFVFDEFGSKMHPLMVKEFIDKFYSIHGDDTIQLIIATHQTSIMTLDLYRADEIWFVDKNGGCSELYSLQEFQPRPDVVLDRNYFAGRYGALPLFDGL